MRPHILGSYLRVFATLSLCVFAGQAMGNETHNIFAYVDTQGKLLISDHKSDNRFKRFDPTRRVARTTALVSAKKTTWTAQRIPSRWAIAREAILTAQRTQQTRSSEFKTIRVATYQNAQHYSSLINTIAEEVGVNANLLHAIIQVESAYNPSATSSKGAQGLMQLIPTTAERFGVEQSYEPADNVRGGARYIKNLLALFNNDVQLAVAAYNAGEGAVQKYKNTIPPYPETQAYVNKVLALFEQRGK